MSSTTLGAGDKGILYYSDMGRKRQPTADPVVAGRIRRKRMRLELTQPQIAEKIGVTVGAISNWENARNGIEECFRAPLAAALETTVEHLFLIDNPKSGLSENKGGAPVSREKSGMYEIYKDIGALFNELKTLTRRVDEIEKQLLQHLSESRPTKARKT